MPHAADQGRPCRPSSWPKLPRLFVLMASIRTWILELVEVRVVHAVVEFLLRQAFGLGACLLSPELVSWFVPQVGLSFNRLLRIGVDGSTQGIAFSLRFHGLADPLADVGPPQPLRRDS